MDLGTYCKFRSQLQFLCCATQQTGCLPFSIYFFLCSLKRVGYFVSPFRRSNLRIYGDPLEEKLLCCTEQEAREQESGEKLRDSQLKH
jgi:hypothetical protein